MRKDNRQQRQTVHRHYCYLTTKSSYPFKPRDSHLLLNRSHILRDGSGVGLANKTSLRERHHPDLLTGLFCSLRLAALNQFALDLASIEKQCSLLKQNGQHFSTKALTGFYFVEDNSRSQNFADPLLFNNQYSLCNIHLFRNRRTTKSWEHHQLSSTAARAIVYNSAPGATR